MPVCQGLHLKEEVGLPTLLPSRPCGGPGSGPRQRGAQGWTQGGMASSGCGGRACSERCRRPGAGWVSAWRWVWGAQAGSTSNPTSLLAVPGEVWPAQGFPACQALSAPGGLRESQAQSLLPSVLGTALQWGFASSGLVLCLREGAAVESSEECSVGASERDTEGQEEPRDPATLLWGTEWNPAPRFKPHRSP